MTTINFHIKTEKLLDGSEVSDVWVFDGGQTRGFGIKFTAVTRDDAERFQADMMELIKKHTCDEVRDTWV